MNSEVDKNRQIVLFENIKKHIDPKLDPIHELCRVLDLSESSVYKRIRGVKIITLRELRLLEEAYPQISATKSRSERTTKLVFEYSNVGFKKYTPTNQLVDVTKEMKTAASDNDALAYYAARDLPLFQIYRYPVLAALYFYYIKRDVMGDHNYQAKPFVLVDELSTAEVNQAKEVWHNFSKISSVEIWGRDTINTFLYLLGEYKKLGLLTDEATIKLLFDKLEEMVSTIKQEAIQGYKADNPKAHFEMYQHTLLYLQNMSLVKMHNMRVVYIQHHVSNILMSNHPEIVKDTEMHFAKIIKQSILLKEPNNVLFNMFFNELKSRIDLGRNLVEQIKLVSVVENLEK